MTSVLERPRATQSSGPPRRPGPVRENVAARPSDPELLLIPVLLLVLAAGAPLARAFRGWTFLPPVGGAVIVALLLSWGCRRLGGGPLWSLLANALGWLVFVAAAFVPESTLLGLVPTPATLLAVDQLWAQGVALVQARPAPVAATPGVLLLTVTGVWAITHMIEGIVFRLRAPVTAIGVALLLWLVPLAVAPNPAAAWPAAVPVLAASAVMLLAFAGGDLGRWGTWVEPARERPRRATAAPWPRLHPLAPSGFLIAAVAIVSGAAVASTLPGFDEQPWYEVRGSGGDTTLTTNPIVNIRRELVSPDQTELLRVSTDTPVYLRLTSLDQYDDERWTNAGIQGNRIEPGQRLPLEEPIAQGTPIQAEIEVANLSEAVLVPAPYQPAQVATSDIDDLHYDQGLSTLTVADPLVKGDRYTVQAVQPEPDRAALPDSVDGAPDRYTALPEIPERVEDLARQIVDSAGATTPAQRALAVQNELRSWEYSLNASRGHSRSAMVDFVTEKVGYCEQFAGTMAVMLRSLDIPARVAVGFTPGQQTDGGAYVVTNENAHAWVEVLFPDHGWIAFEPTPRDDGNVLVPEAADLAPGQTLAQGGGQAPEEPDAGPEEPTPPPEPEPAPEPEPDGAAGGDRGGSGRLWVALAVGLCLVAGGAGFAAWRSRRATAGRTPVERVLGASAAVERVGRGLGCPRGPSETDREYLDRLGERGHDAATLADAAAEARYAPELSAETVAEAEHAAGQLRSRLLAGRSPWRRRLVLLRADTTVLAESVRATLRRGSRRSLRLRA